MNWGGRYSNTIITTREGVLIRLYQDLVLSVCFRTSRSPRAGWPPGDRGATRFLSEASINIGPNIVSYVNVGGRQSFSVLLRSLLKSAAQHSMAYYAMS